MLLRSIQDQRHRNRNLHFVLIGNKFDSRGNHIIRCLSFNARSLANKISEFQSLVVYFDMVAGTETWLKQEIMNCELLSQNNFKIHRKDRANRIGGGVMLAIRDNILSIRRKDLENDLCYDASL